MASRQRVTWRISSNLHPISGRQVAVKTQTEPLLRKDARWAASQVMHEARPPENGSEKVPGRRGFREQRLTLRSADASASDVWSFFDAPSYVEMARAVLPQILKDQAPPLQSKLTKL